MAFEIKAGRKAEGDLMKVPFDRKKGHYKALQMVQALLSSDEVWSKWKVDSREAERKEMEKLARLKAARILSKKTGVAAKK
jgi:hypothetical protein